VAGFHDLDRAGVSAAPCGLELQILALIPEPGNVARREASGLRQLEHEGRLPSAPPRGHGGEAVTLAAA
jgi:hypothetical protein